MEVVLPAHPFTLRQAETNTDKYVYTLTQKRTE